MYRAIYALPECAPVYASIVEFHCMNWERANSRWMTIFESVCFSTGSRLPTAATLGTLSTADAPLVREQPDLQTAQPTTKFGILAAERPIFPDRAACNTSSIESDRLRLIRASMVVKRQSILRATTLW
jgi:hypothetical protein